MGFFDKFKTVKKIDDYNTLIAELESEIAGYDASLSNLLSQREETLFSGGETALAKLDVKIDDLKKTLEPNKLAISGLIRRRDEAVAAAEKEALEKKIAEVMARSRGGDAPLRKSILDFHTQALKLIALVEDIDRQEALMDEDDRWLRSVGRNDLCVGSVYQELSNKLVAEFIARGQTHSGDTCIVYAPRAYLNIRGYYERGTAISDKYQPYRLIKP